MSILDDYDDYLNSLNSNSKPFEYFLIESVKNVINNYNDKPVNITQLNDCLYKSQLR